MSFLMNRAETQFMLCKIFIIINISIVVDGLFLMSRHYNPSDDKHVNYRLYAAFTN